MLWQSDDRRSRPVTLQQRSRVSTISARPASLFVACVPCDVGQATHFSHGIHPADGVPRGAFSASNLWYHRGFPHSAIVLRTRPLVCSRRSTHAASAAMTLGGTPPVEARHAAAGDVGSPEDVVACDGAHRIAAYGAGRGSQSPPSLVSDASTSSTRETTTTTCSMTSPT